MEDNSNNFDSATIVKELQAINKGLTDVNSSQKELMEYIIAKDQASDEEKEAAEKEAAEKQEAEKQEAEKQEEETKAAETKADSQTETYTLLLTDIRDEMRLNNQMMAGSFIFYGIICGIILFKILWDKLN